MNWNLFPNKQLNAYVRKFEISYHRLGKKKKKEIRLPRQNFLLPNRKPRNSSLITLHFPSPDIFLHDVARTWETRISRSSSRNSIRISESNVKAKCPPCASAEKRCCATWPTKEIRARMCDVKESQVSSSQVAPSCEHKMAAEHSRANRVNTC